MRTTRLASVGDIGECLKGIIYLLNNTDFTAYIVSIGFVSADLYSSCRDAHVPIYALVWIYPRNHNGTGFVCFIIKLVCEVQMKFFPFPVLLSTN